MGDPPWYTSAMFIKKVRKSNKGSGKIYEYLHLVESIRTENGPRQRLILNLGALDVPADQFKELANCIEAMLTGQNQLFSPDREIEKHARNAVMRIRAQKSEEQDALQSGRDQNPEPDYQTVDVASMQAGEVRSLGPEYVCHSLWNELQFNEILMSNGVSKHVLPLLEALVVGRLISPGSERHTWNWSHDLSAVYELSGPPLRESLSSLYRAGDVLFDLKEQLEVHLARRERDLFSLPERLCLLDLTNAFFEGSANGNPKAKRGRSKEKRSDCKLLTLALVVDENGFAKHSRLYPGNQSEPQTLEDILEDMIRLHPGLSRERTVVVDAGIATEANLALLKDKKFHYIVVHRGKADFSAADLENMTVIREKQQYRIEVVRKERDGQAMLLCRSSARKGKDFGIRNRQEQLFVERLRYFHEGLSLPRRTKLYDKVVEKVGRLREKYPRASKLYDVEVTPEEKPGKKVKASAIVWRKKEQYDQVAQFDGCYVLCTDLCNLSDKDIWETYVMLTRVENAFRSMKSALGLRPNFHQNEDRADAHMFISVLAYHILHAIEYRLGQCGDHRSWSTLREVLSTHQRLTIEYNVKEQDRIVRRHVRLCSTPEPEHKEIYRNLGLKDEPLPRKTHTVK
ncbi:transposase IS4 family protein [Desulfatibacillum aliphaticivorans]|uniref:Transposase IS4 family protein n=2 Tax=Desulfatibacillum aliphaticivorans TaxID=218208 RepID=B8FJL1_DESAL|nr:IS1634 family transposase [Desulfatibacillum aliphaticivorans]ACL05433.1 transposase IS4 family protein [Desulfatibacillum aliphaticivorans]ACL05680.1 transposase IS4 family protein [Desulfatibacillum aliphaticivorans]